jgi:hypothetical protein
MCFYHLQVITESSNRRAQAWAGARIGDYAQQCFDAISLRGAMTEFIA